MKDHTPRCLVALVILLSDVSAYASAPDGRYTYPTADTVYDTKTKLTWQRSISPGTYEWAGAKTYCAGLNLNGTGWRLPSIKELATILDRSRSRPAIDTYAFLDTPTYLAYSWSSTPDASSGLSAWSLGYDSGRISSSAKVGNSFNVRCVR
jgi:hypothetical protein